METFQEIDLAEIEIVLREHPAVREAAVSVSESALDDRKLSAYVVPDYEYIERLTAGSEEERKRVLKNGKLYDMALGARKADPAQPGRNFLGWSSSYTKQQIPDAQMQEWVDLTVREILSLRPSEVLEMGCGSGLLLLRIARECKRYVGVDVSSLSLKRVREQMNELEGPWDAVTLLERPADNFDGFAEGSFDALVVNSVTQYFPNTSYLLRVLEGGALAVRPGGALFIGDVRSLPLAEAFAVSVELYQAQPASLLEDLRGRVRRRINQEAEMVISPAFFLAFQQRSPQVSRVEIKLKPGSFQNEMTGFRYDAILHLGPAPVNAVAPRWLDAGERDVTADAIREMLESRKPEILGLMRVANARIGKDVEAAHRLSGADGSGTVEDFKEELRQAQTCGIAPEALGSLGDELGYQVDMSWASSRSDGSYDVLFRRLAAAAEPHRDAVAWPQPAAISDDLARHVNRPGRIALRQGLVSQLTEHCKLRLSADKVPATFVVMDALPLTADGMLDRQALVTK